jgi:DNA polymerase III delta prime subunit
MTHPPVEINEIAYKLIEGTGKNIFLTGKAGTGKTTFLKSLANSLLKNYVIAAPTGIAAINAGGVTLHSLLLLPLSAYIPDSNYIFSENLNINTPKTIVHHVKFNKQKLKLIRELELLVIDEASMLRADVLDMADAVLRIARRSKQPFGGIQLLFIGDLLQLPPVVKNDEWNILRNYYPSPFFFHSKALREMPPMVVELKKIYRQSDDTFISILNRFRNNQVQKDDLIFLNKFHKPGFEPPKNEHYIFLTTHNYKADSVNKKELEKLPGKKFIYEAEVKGDFGDHLFPCEKFLELKIGAQVMFLKNDSSGKKRYFNGKIGKITELDEETIFVDFSDGSEPVEVEKYKWENKRFILNSETNEIEEKEIGSFVHYPLRAAWAITVHKSQGLTFEKAILDMENVFAPGQIYVALSRLTSLEGLVLASALPGSIPNTSEAVINFNTSAPEKEELQKVLKEDSKVFLKDNLLKAFDFNHLNHLFKVNASADNSEETELGGLKEKFKTMFGTWTEKAQMLKENGDKFCVQIHQIFSTEIDNEFLSKRIEAATSYFQNELTTIIKEINALLLTLSDIKRSKGFQVEQIELRAECFSKIRQMKKVAYTAGSVLSGISADLQKLEQELREIKEAVISVQKISLPQKEKSPKKKKGDTQQISFNLYISGKSTAEIAAERKLAETTIETHLAHFISSGELDIFKLISKDKLEKLLEIYKNFPAIKKSEIKEKFQDTFSYTEIKYAEAYSKRIIQ